MLYRMRRDVAARRFDRAIAGVLDTPPAPVTDAPWTIVSMVAISDLRMYLLAAKVLTRKLGGGRLVAIVTARMGEPERDLLRRHFPGIELVTLEEIDTGPCQRGGTWERLLYILDRARHEYVIQLDCDALAVGAIPEVVECVRAGRPFVLSDGYRLRSMRETAAEAATYPDDYFPTRVERTLAEYPASEQLCYVRGSSCFAGFAQGGAGRAAVEAFHGEMERRLGFAAWRSWGSEQCASNFALANSPGCVVLPYPRYASFLPGVDTSDPSLLHFVGTYRFRHGTFARHGQAIIAELQHPA